MSRKNSDIQNVFGLSFIDVFANTLGALAFILILVILMIGLRFGLPSINTESLPEAYEGVQYELWLAARGGGGDYNWQIVEGELPAGLIMVDSIKGHISGIPTLATSTNAREVYRFTAKVGMSGDVSENVDTHEYEIVLNNSKIEQLEILSISELPKAIKGETYPLTLAASGGRPPYSWHLTSGTIAGLTLSTNGLFTGTVNAPPGKYRFTTAVKDQFNNSAQGNFVLEILEIEDPPEIPQLLVHTDTLPAAIQTKRFKVALAAEGGLAPYTWNGNTNATGLEVTTDGYLVGTPSTIGEHFTVDLAVESSDGQSASLNGIRFQVDPAPKEHILPLKITSLDSLPESFSDKTYTIALAARGGIPPYTWELSDRGNIEGIIDLSKDGIVHLQTGLHGTYHFSVGVTDDQKQHISKTIFLKVNPSLQPLELNTAILPTGVKGFPYNLTMSALGGYPPYHWTLEAASDFADGVSVDTTGYLHGIPNEAWRGQANLVVRDFAGTTIKKAFPFEILESGEGSVLPKLEILTDSIPTLFAGEPQDLHIATRGGGFPIQWKIDGELPKGVQFIDGRLSGNPVGTTEPTLVKLTATDPIRQTDSVELQIGSRSVVDAYWRNFAIIAIIVALLALALAVLIWWLVRRSKKTDLKILTESIPNARSSFPYKVYLAATGGVPPYTWKMVEGELPMGLKLHPKGIIEGTPFKGVKLDEIQEVSFTVKVVDSIRNSVKQQL